jgi:hypothetical protein
MVYAHAFTPGIYGVRKLGPSAGNAGQRPAEMIRHGRSIAKYNTVTPKIFAVK